LMPATNTENSVALIKKRRTMCLFSMSSPC
jgi:hypothetical protein